HLGDACPPSARIPVPGTYRPSSQRAHPPRETPHQDPYQVQDSARPLVPAAPSSVCHSKAYRHPVTVTRRGFGYTARQLTSTSPAPAQTYESDASSSPLQQAAGLAPPYAPGSPAAPPSTDQPPAGPCASPSRQQSPPCQSRSRAW